MPNLSESSTWEAGIYEWTEADVVQGGPAGIDNVPTRQLANRTKYLKDLAEGLSANKLDKSAKSSQAQAMAGTDDATWMTPLRVAQAIAALASMALASESAAGKVELATAAETMAGLDTSRAAHPAGVKAAISAALGALVNSAPTTLDTLAELSAALGNDPNFATTLSNLIGLKAPLDSPTLTGQPTAPTPARFKNDLSIVTAEFINRLGINFPREGGIPVPAAAQITAAQSGRWFDVYTNANVTLPPLSEVPFGTAYAFRSVSPFSLLGYGGEAIVHQNSVTLVNSYPTLAGETTIVVSNGSAWYIIISGFGAPSFASSLGQNGYRKLPSGDIEQWGYVSESTHSADYKPFAIPFPTACDNVVLQIEASTAGSFGASVGTVVQVVDRTKFLWSGAGTWGGGGYAFYRAIGR